MATKADLHRAIVRTAALAHWRHHFTACAHPANHNAFPAVPSTVAQAGDYPNGSVGHSAGL
jgi:hypothetical protein